jgi:DNA-binding protein H-NS
MKTAPFTTSKYANDQSPPPGGPPASGNSGAPPKGKPALPFDLEAQPDEVLALLETEVPKVRQRKQAKREAELFAEFKERARAIGVTPVRLAAAFGLKLAPSAPAKLSLLRPTDTPPEAGVDDDDGRRHVKAVYWNLKDHSQRWSGRGKQPQWVKDHLAAGGTMDELRIPESAF